MKKYLNGKMVEMSQSELAAYEEQRAENAETTPVTDEERIEVLIETVRALEEQLAAAKILLGVE